MVQSRTSGTGSTLVLSGLVLFLGVGCGQGAGSRPLADTRSTTPQTADNDLRADTPSDETEHAITEAEPETPAKPRREIESELVAVFPFIRVNVGERLVEFDGTISPLMDPTGEGRRFYIEQIVCTQGTKEHESLVVTRARPSHLHAALLMIDAERGHPVFWTYPEGRTVVHAPAGDRVVVEVEFVDQDAQTQVIDPLVWVVPRDGVTKFPRDEGKWLFAGSVERETSAGLLYEADAAGTVVGLASFGTEVIAWSQPISHEEADGDLAWIADTAAMPPANTPVTVRIRLAD